MTDSATASTRVRRLPVVDEYVEGGESAVFVGETVVTLSHVPTAMLAVLGEEWTEVAALEAALVERFGAPDGGSVAEAVEAVVRTLVSHDLLEVDPAPHG